MNTGMMATTMMASRRSMENRYRKAPMNIARTDSVLGMVSARKFTTTLTSVSSLLSTSPECRASLPCHSDRSIRSSSSRCMRFCALMPSRFLTHIELMLRAKSARMSSPNSPTDSSMEPGTVPAATSMACFTAHTCPRLTATSPSPITALSVACSLLACHALHSHPTMSAIS